MMVKRKKYMVSNTGLFCSVGAFACGLLGVLLLGLSSGAISQCMGGWKAMYLQLVSGNWLFILFWLGILSFLLSFILIGVGVVADRCYLKERVDSDTFEAWQQGK